MLLFLEEVEKPVECGSFLHLPPKKEQKVPKGKNGEVGITTPRWNISLLGTFDK